MLTVSISQMLFLVWALLRKQSLEINVLVNYHSITNRPFLVEVMDKIVVGKYQQHLASSSSLDIPNLFIHLDMVQKQYVTVANRFSESEI